MWQAAVQSKSIKQEQSLESGRKAFKNVCMWQRGPRFGLLHRTWQVKKATWNNSSFQPPFPLFSCQIQSPCLAADVVRPAPAATRSKFLLALKKNSYFICSSALMCTGWLRLIFDYITEPRLCWFFIHTNTHTYTHVQFGHDSNKSCDLPSQPSGFRCGLHRACRTDYFYHNVPLLSGQL